ncbi:MAG: hypothetical protein WAO12_02510 [Venatoribacter sp.]
MNVNAFKKGFLSAFDPFAQPVKRKQFSNKTAQMVIDGEYEIVASTEAQIRQSFIQALNNVKQAHQFK